MNLPNVSDVGQINGRDFVRISDIGNFSVYKTFDCGQCFRFDPDEGGIYSFSTSGVAYGKTVTFAEDGEDLLIIGSGEKDYKNIWEKYLSLDADYGEIDAVITKALDEKGNLVMRRAAEVSAGIRLLRQEPWETLCSFIVSQNNNIPRIKKIIRAMCDEFGEKTEDGLSNSFPTPRALVEAGEGKIFALKTGFRAKYIYDAAVKVESGEIDLDAILKNDDFASCESELMKIKGVGPKVAACALLFGFEKTEAYPVDTWMKKVAARHFENGPDPAKFGKYAGIAQQYLFYMERYING